MLASPFKIIYACEYCDVKPAGALEFSALVVEKLRSLGLCPSTLVRMKAKPFAGSYQEGVVFDSPVGGSFLLGLISSRTDVDFFPWSPQHGNNEKELELLKELLLNEVAGIENGDAVADVFVEDFKQHFDAFSSENVEVFTDFVSMILAAQGREAILWQDALDAIIKLTDKGRQMKFESILRMRNPPQHAAFVFIPPDKLYTGLVRLHEEYNLNRKSIIITLDDYAGAVTKETLDTCSDLSSSVYLRRLHADLPPNVSMLTPNSAAKIIKHLGPEALFGSPLEPVKF